MYSTHAAVNVRSFVAIIITRRHRICWWMMTMPIRRWRHGEIFCMHPHHFYSHHHPSPLHILSPSASRLSVCTPYSVIIFVLLSISNHFFGFAYYFSSLSILYAVFRSETRAVAKVDSETRRYSRLYKIRGSRLLNVRPEESPTHSYPAHAVNKSILVAVELT